MITILVDHDIEGQAALLWDTLVEQGWPELVPVQKLTLREIGLPENSTDRIVWRYVQEQQVFLITGNRNMRDSACL